MNKRLRVHEGFTNNYLIPGIIGVIVGIVLSVCFSYHGLAHLVNYLGIPFIIIGLLLISGTNGLEIDLEKMLVRKYGSFLGVKIGRWKSIENASFAQLYISSENVKTFGTFSMHSAVLPNQGVVKSITYDISLDTKTGERIQIYDFLKYKTAKKALKMLETELKIPVKDKVREKLIENIEKRRARGW